MNGIPHVIPPLLLLSEILIYLLSVHLLVQNTGWCLGVTWVISTIVIGVEISRRTFGIAFARQCSC